MSNPSARVPPLVLDRAEQLFASALYVGMVYRIWPENLSLNQLGPALYLVSEGIVLFFLLIRRSSANISLRPVDWFVAFAGTTFPLLVMKGAEPLTLFGGAFLTMFGIFVQVGAKLSLARSFGMVAANRGVKTSGAYRFVRHPMYLGYMISHVGFLLMVPLAWNAVVFIPAWALLVTRIHMEERLLSQDPAYQTLKQETPWRLIPFVY